MLYRRLQLPGASYFFTVVTFRRRRLFNNPQLVKLLGQAFRHVQQRYPFKIDAIVILPDHIHSIWTLPEGDTDYAKRWRLIKNFFTWHCPKEYKGYVNCSRQRKKEQGIWQRRYWEHWLRDENDLHKHLDYIHYNPVKHGLVDAPMKWPYSSFHRYTKLGFYDENWGANEAMSFDDKIGYE